MYFREERNTYLSIFSHTFISTLSPCHFFISITPLHYLHYIYVDYVYKALLQCVGGGGGEDLLDLLCLISNTLPQLEQSSFHPSTVLHHRHLLQTTNYNHLLLLHHLISRKEKNKQQRLGTPLSQGVEKPEGPSTLQPTTES